MIICLNPNCQKPENPDGTNFCLSCGTGLIPLLRDRYRIISLLGSGGFGRTFLAEDTDMPSARRCVIKQLKPINNNPQIYQLVQERFQREAAVLEQLGEENPNIPSLYAYFTLSGQFYLVQQWIDGETLTTIVKEQGTLNEIYVRGLITKVLEIIDYVHAKRIIHRDIKPDNIIVRRRDGFPVLIDFGAVKETMGTMVTAQGVPTSSIIIGTPGYMPSEQAAGRPLPSSDLFSFGLTVIYTLTGKIPQQLPLDEDTGDVIWHHYAPNVSQPLIAILNKAIQWHPRDRYPKAKDLLDALQCGVSTSLSPQPSVSHNAPTVPISQPPISHNTPTTPISQPPISHNTPTTPISQQSTKPITPVINVPLKSAVGVNYTTLRNLLAAGKWFEADQETANVMLQAAGRTKEAYLDLNACRNFPPEDLRTIDQLWLKYSNDKFGLSVQKKIWVDKGGNLDGSYDYDTYVKLADEVGWFKQASWLNYDQLTFTLKNAPVGHLPSCLCWCVGSWHGGGYYSFLFFKL